MVCKWTRETKFPHAVWAAGRGLIALLLPNFDVVDNLWLEPFSWEVTYDLDMLLIMSLCIAVTSICIFILGCISYGN